MNKCMFYKILFGLVCIMALVLLLLSMDNYNPPVETQKTFLPGNATNIVLLANGWVYFDLKIGDKTHTFLYNGASRGQTAHAAITKVATKDD